MNDVIRLPSLQPMKKILILDDNFDILVLYKTLVSHMGLSVRTTTDAFEALRWLDEDRFDLIMTDMRMPTMAVRSSSGRRAPRECGPRSSPSRLSKTSPTPTNSPLGSLLLSHQTRAFNQTGGDGHPGIGRRRRTRTRGRDLGEREGRLEKISACPLAHRRSCAMVRTQRRKFLQVIGGLSVEESLRDSLKSDQRKQYQELLKGCF